MGRVYTTIQFFSHLLRSRRWDAFHSPYLFRLFTHCCNDQIVNPIFGEIESRRKQWLSSKQTISRRDYGAGSAFQLMQEKVRISRIAKYSLSHPFQCRFMSRLAAFSKANHIIELGTSLGISAAYYAAGGRSMSIDTVEGDSGIAKLASELLDSLHLNNVKVHALTFEEFISGYNPPAEKLDMLFLDGDHRFEATLQYYQALQRHFHSGTIVIVDDIYWSEEMTSCWKKLTTLPEVRQSVNCFHFGLLFFSSDFLHKENHEVYLPLRMLMR